MTRSVSNTPRWAAFASASDAHVSAAVLDKYQASPWRLDVVDGNENGVAPRSGKSTRSVRLQAVYMSASVSIVSPGV